MSKKHICLPWCKIQVNLLCRSKTFSKQVSKGLKYIKLTTHWAQEWFDLDLWTCDLKINMDHLLTEGNPCTKFGIDQMKGSKDIEWTTFGLQTDRLTNRQTDRQLQNNMPPFSKGGGGHKKSFCYCLNNLDKWPMDHINHVSSWQAWALSKHINLDKDFKVSTIHLSFPIQRDDLCKITALWFPRMEYATNLSWFDMCHNIKSNTYMDHNTFNTF